MYNLPVPGDLIFQSPDDTYANANYFSYFDSIVPVSISSNPANSTYRLRVYNYNSSSNLIYGRNLFDNNTDHHSQYPIIIWVDSLEVY